MLDVESLDAAPVLYLISGLPCSGKTTLAKQLEQEHGATRMCPDEWLDILALDYREAALRAEVEAFQWTMTRHLLTRGRSVIIEWGLWSRAERDHLREGAIEHDALPILYVLDPGLAVLWDRMVARNARAGPNDTYFTHDELVAWDARFERPDDYEFSGYAPLPHLL